MERKRQEYEERLRTRGLRSTKGRRAVLETLMKSGQPLAAEQIFLLLKERDSQINLSTVYRTLESLETAELITRISIHNDDRMLFEYNCLGHRHYLVCTECKKIITVQHCPLGEYEKALENETGFSIYGHKLYLYGYCPQCKTKNT
ncbi:Fur family transcriptional regulator [Parasporobacterium paucivorans]|uniref:Fur family transcriptional regulator, ferric uptake regulator n=1 Tax=Parasporobacterium paucivorans DSM 15970 TaxID=1122934 RepID=A0A1M6L8Y0_9FIRM|nr:Fur family transcriptional regulator [Parasporobacterium paucivorans]SHJ67661.1 Fur family transcriptional regulator, ferric uptake regulator [Parasporobacterium paucivorans DSM 15970]